jgi:predicted Zn-dependent peptidase
MSGGFGSKLFQKIREDLGLAYYIHLYYQQYSEIGHYEVNLGVDHKNIQAAISAVMEELTKFTSGGVSKIELQRAKNLLEGNFVTYFETSETIANWYGSQILLNREEVFSNEELVKIIQDVSLDEILTMWQPLFNKNNLQLYTLGKKVAGLHL